MKPKNIYDVFAEIGQAEFEKHRERSEREWALFVRDRNKYLEWERQVGEMFNVCNRITHTLRTMLRLAIGWQSPSLFYEPVGVREAIVYLFNWRGARERHTLKWSGKQLHEEIFGIDFQNKIKRQPPQSRGFGRVD